MSKDKDIGIITLCGLIVGPILGSGIVLLPPMAYGIIGKWSVFAWIIIMILGIIFAYVFIFLTLNSPGNEGVAIAVGSVLGDFWRELAQNFLTAAVCFGPVAVLITASGFLKSFRLFSDINVEVIAFVIEIICAAVIISGIKTLGQVTLLLTGFTAILLLCGSVYTLLFASNIHLPGTLFPLSKFGYTLLLLFWAIVGWEVIGNYIEDIKNPPKTLMKAMTISLVIIVGLYMVVALSIQSIVNGTHDIIAIMTPLFGVFALPVIGIIAMGLCISTYLMIVGAVSRMSAARAASGRLPVYLSKLNRNESPSNAVITFVIIHSLVLLLTGAGILNLDSIVTCANVFFLSNAIIGLFAGFRLLHNMKLKTAIIILIMAFTLLLFKANLWSLLLLIMVILLSLYNSKKLGIISILKKTVL
ncbi:APC family permease [Clostridium sp. WILCCON 0269]|uniref:APC family permease n=1 Tax=Candidatus Clostridium eludens TaxID=3381663 RepID=A0ABW8SEW5_9CLOT